MNASEINGFNNTNISLNTNLILLRYSGRSGRRRGQRSSPLNLKKTARLHTTRSNRQGHFGMAELQERLRLLERKTGEPQQGDAVHHQPGAGEIPVRPVNQPAEQPTPGNVVHATDGRRHGYMPAFEPAAVELEPEEFPRRHKRCCCCYIGEHQHFW